MKKILAVSLLLSLLGGCVKPSEFTLEPLPQTSTQPTSVREFDANGDGKADFLMFSNQQGRVDRIGYPRGNGSPDAIVQLDEIPFANCRHLVIILDGFSYDVVKSYYDKGGLRLFPPPTKVIAPYPTLTDLCLEDVLDYIPCKGFEAKYYSRREGKVIGGPIQYLSGNNEPYNRLLQYRINTLADAVAYVKPWMVFNYETNRIKRLFDEAKTKELRAYLVSTAAISTAQGRQGQLDCLEKVERMVNQVVYETNGMVKVTLLSDHGHTYTEGTLVDFESVLKRDGWRVTKSLKNPKDVVTVQFGLVTWLGFYTNSPAELAATVITAEGVDLVSYSAGDTVEVLGKDGAKAIIHRRDNTYRYATASGDPLQLKDILSGLKGTDDGFYDSQDLFNATTSHIYPNAPERLWRAHFGLVENPPDVIASLDDRHYAGEDWFTKQIKLKSTHGSLNYTNSDAFIITTFGPLPPAIRSREIAHHMSLFVGEAWPVTK